MGTEYELSHYDLYDKIEVKIENCDPWKYEVFYWEQNIERLV